MTNSNTDVDAANEDKKTEASIGKITPKKQAKTAIGSNGIPSDNEIKESIERGEKSLIALTNTFRVCRD